MKKVIENININLKRRYNKVKKLIRKGYWFRALDYIDKITHKADIDISLERPDIAILEYNILQNEIEVLEIKAYSRGVYTVLRLTYVKNKRELTIDVEQSVLISQ